MTHQRNEWTMYKQKFLNIFFHNLSTYLPSTGSKNVSYFQFFRIFLTTSTTYFPNFTDDDNKQLEHAKAVGKKSDKKIIFQIKCQKVQKRV